MCSGKDMLHAIGRVLLASVFFLSAAISKIPNFPHTVERMRSAGVPLPSVLLVGAILFLLAGSLSLAAGFKARAGAMLLLIFTALGTSYFHAFWTAADPAAMQAQFIAFMKNIALIGALLMVVANGAGPVSLDARNSRD